MDPGQQILLTSTVTIAGAVRLACAYPHVDGLVLR